MLAPAHSVPPSRDHGSPTPDLPVFADRLQPRGPRSSDISEPGGRSKHFAIERTARREALSHDAGLVSLRSGCRIQIILGVINASPAISSVWDLYQRCSMWRRNSVKYKAPRPQNK